MKPVIALVGRPNVGKSTLFNQLTRSRDALVADFPGLTRDRQYGTARFEGREFIVIDTGGLSGEETGIDVLMQRQAWLAVDEADLVFFIVDARAGLSAADEMVAEQLRRQGKPILLVVNKIDGIDESQVLGEFSSLGLGEASFIAASHGRGLHGLMARAMAKLPKAAEESELCDDGRDRIRIAVVGRPNVGKSTLINRLLGEERVLTFDQPGTTRDSIFIPFERDAQKYTLIDTAGVRRRARINETIEKFSVVKTLQAMDAANVVILVLDAHEGITEQDQHLLGFVIERGRALIIAINKWDGMTLDERERVKQQIDYKLEFVRFAEIYFISALHGTGVGLLMEAAVKAYRASMSDISTSALTRELEVATFRHPPPVIHGRRIKLRYAHQGGRNPPIIVIHGKQTDRLPGSYQRYLENHFREAFQLHGTPIRLEFRTDENPYEGKRDKLTSLQRYKARKKTKRRAKSVAGKP
ncbi:MAG TPA: ribosome biogenesis GTPase Der [Halothiobacillus sp.]|nr:ribosome biogenesis GTPase Der [Halothiobacillus sp.]